MEYFLILSAANDPDKEVKNMALDPKLLYPGRREDNGHRLDYDKDISEYNINEVTINGSGNKKKFPSEAEISSSEKRPTSSTEATTTTTTTSKTLSNVVSKSVDDNNSREMLLPNEPRITYSGK